MFGIMLYSVNYLLVFANIMLDTVDDLGQGALSGLAAGAIVGAIVWSITNAPDTLGRVLLFTIILGILMLLFQTILILNTLPEISMGSLIAAFQDRSTEIGQMIIRAGQWVGLSALGGALVAVLLSVPGETIKGALIGVVIGALLGAGINAGVRELGINLRAGTALFQIVVGLLTGGVLTSVGGR